MRHSSRPGALHSIDADDPVEAQCRVGPTCDDGLTSKALVLVAVADIRAAVRVLCTALYETRHAVSRRVAGMSPLVDYRNYPSRTMAVYATAVSSVMLERRRAGLYRSSLRLCMYLCRRNAFIQHYYHCVGVIVTADSDISFA